MDTVITPEQITQHLTDLDRRRRDTAAKRYDTEQKLLNQRTNLTYAEKNRAALLPDLTNEDVAVNAWAQNELDKMDQNILERRRLIEALEGTLAKLDSELDSVSKEWKTLDEQVEAQERAEKFEACKERILKELAELNSHLDGARLSAGAFVMDAFTFSEEFGPAASQFLTAEAEKFFAKQNGLDSRFRLVHGWNGNMWEFVVRPMLGK